MKTSRNGNPLEWNNARSRRVYDTMLSVCENKFIRRRAGLETVKGSGNEVVYLRARQLLLREQSKRGRRSLLRKHQLLSLHRRLLLFP
jgi:hypothetical protein